MKTSVQSSIVVGVLLAVGISFAIVKLSDGEIVDGNKVSSQSGGRHSSNASSRSLYPAAASAADKLLIGKWRTLNEICSENHPPAGVCDALDKTMKELKTRGWCWGAPLDRPASDFGWHHCGEFDTDKLR